MSDGVLKLNAKRKEQQSTQLGSVFPSAELLAQLVDMGFPLQWASKALVETKNQSLDAALDWMDAHPYSFEQDIQEEFVSTIPQPESVTTPPATVPVQPTVDTVKSRYEKSSKEAFLERQRQKEIERLKKERLEKEREKERIRREIEAERLERAKRSGSISSSEEPKSTVTQNEEKLKFEAKQRERAEEEKQRLRMEDMKRREEVKQLLEEDKAKRLEKFPHLAQTKTEPRTKSSEDRSKQEWLREKQIEREERERLRRELEADRKLRAEKLKRPEVLAEEEKKQTEITRRLAELRRERLGITQHQEPASQSITTAPQQESPPSPDADNMVSESTQQQQQQQLSYREIQRQRYEEYLQKKKMEEIRLKREEAINRMKQEAKAASTAAAVPTPATTVSTPPQAATQEECILQIRLPDGRLLRLTFKPTDTIRDVHEAVAPWLPLGTLFNLIMPIPHTEFDDRSMGLTLQEAGLVPRASLTVLTLRNRGVITPAMPSHVEEEDIDTDEMTYEELLELERRIGNAKVGFDDATLACLPSVQYDDLKHTENKCAICLEDFSSQDIVCVLPCSHIFHRLHIWQWLRDHRHCPVCQQEVEL